MPIIVGPKLNLLYNASISENYVDAFRPFIQAMDALIMCNVISVTTVVPPASPAGGDAYLLPTSPGPGGVWSGHAGQLAVWGAQVTNSGTNTLTPQWVYYTPLAGWIIWNTTLGQLLVYNGSSWNAITQGVTEPVASYADQIGSGTVSATANVVKTWSFNLYSQCTADNIGLDVTTPDNSANLYSIGIYNNAGVLLASTGAVPGSTFCAGTGLKVNSIAGGATVFAAGNYFLGLTTDAGTAVFSTAPSQFLGTSNHSSGASTGGALPGTISIPSTSYSIDSTRPAVVLF